jgi:protein TonB
MSPDEPMSSGNPLTDGAAAARQRPPQPPMFSNLLASKPKKEGSGFGSGLTSALFHVALIILVVWGTAKAAENQEDDPDEVTLIQIEDEPPPPEPPPPPKPDAPPPPEVIDIPKGFQTLAPPTVIPPDIPPPSTGPAISEADFTGEGIEGGNSKGTTTKVTAENVEAAPTFTPYTVAPELKNREEVGRALQRNYPPLLRDAGIGGTVLIWALIDEAGAVMRTQVKTGSGHDALDAAATKVGEIMKFTPALNRDQKVKVWIALPIVFKST